LPEFAWFGAFKEARFAAPLSTLFLRLRAFERGFLEYSFYSPGADSQATEAVQGVPDLLEAKGRVAFLDLEDFILQTLGYPLFPSAEILAFQTLGAFGLVSLDPER